MDSVVEQVVDGVVDKQGLSFRPVKRSVVRKDDENKIIEFVIG